MVRLHFYAQFPNLPYHAMESLIKMTRFGFLDPPIVKSYLTYSSLFPVGSFVELSNKFIGRVIEANGTSFTKPTVSVLMSASGQMLPKDKIYQVNLHESKDLQITRPLASSLFQNVGIMDGF